MILRDCEPCLPIGWNITRSTKLSPENGRRKWMNWEGEIRESIIQAVDKMVEDDGCLEKALEILINH